ncbi:MAG TPA: proteasome subunit alpha [Sporichthyaceae bacterium]|nr:proteasome subunit alpha [Sporichthyaceae bacterium]
MTTPFYISPEQIMKDKADYARKGIARGRSAVVLQYEAGILLVAENWSPALHKISEIYDQIGFAAVGRYNEFENLRIMGVRIADLRGYSYDRRDVTARALANAYAQTLGTIFSSAGEKPFEVELVVAEVGDDTDSDQIYRLTYDGSVTDEHGYMVMGGQTEPINSYLEKNYTPGRPLDDALLVAVRALGESGQSGQQNADGPRRLAANQLEAAVLDRARPKRKFRRLSRARLEEILGAAPAEEPPAPAGAEEAERPPVGPEPPKPGSTDVGDSGGPAL